MVSDHGMLYLIMNLSEKIKVREVKRFSQFPDAIISQDTMPHLVWLSESGIYIGSIDLALRTCLLSGERLDTLPKLLESL